MFWRKFNKHKPKKSGWYLCTIAFPFDGNKHQTYVMELYYYIDSGRWIDNRQKSIFNTYEVYGYGDGNERKRLYATDMCDRTKSVVAWKKLPKPYKRRDIDYV